MNVRLKIALTAAVGFALGLTCAATSDRPDRPAELDVSAVRGHVSGDPPRELRPLTLRVGDSLEQLGHPAAERPAVATVYLVVSGVPVVASFEVTP